MNRIKKLTAGLLGLLMILTALFFGGRCNPVFAAQTQDSIETVRAEAEAAMRTGSLTAAEKKLYELADASPMIVTAIDYGGGSGNWGDATLVESDGHYLLMDTCTPDPQKHIINYLKDKGVSNLDIYVSHYHHDHCGQVNTILNDDYFTVGKVYLPDTAQFKGIDSSYLKGNDSWFNSISNTAKKKGASVVVLKGGERFTVGLAVFDVLYMHGDNKTANYSSGSSYINCHSLVTMVRGGGIRYLTAGDIEKQVEEKIVSLKLDVDADLFKLSHHGGSTSNIESFVRAVTPEYAFYNWDDHGSFGSGWVKGPVNRTSKMANVFSVRYNGTLVFTCREGRIRVEGEKRIKELEVQARNTLTGKTETVKVNVNEGSGDNYHVFRSSLPDGFELIN